MFLSFKIQGYLGASIEQPMDFPNLSKINLIIGPNNSGKSIPFRAFQMLSHLHAAPQGIMWHDSLTRKISELSKLHWHRQNTAKPITIELSFSTQNGICDTSNFYCCVLPSSQSKYYKIAFSIYFRPDDNLHIAQNPFVHVHSKEGSEIPLFQDTYSQDLMKWKVLLDEHPGYADVNSDPTAWQNLSQSRIRLSYLCKGVKFVSSNRKLTTNKEIKEPENIITGRDITSKLLKLNDSDADESTETLNNLLHQINKLLDPTDRAPYTKLTVNTDGEIRLHQGKSKYPLSRLGSGLEALIILVCELLLNEEESTYFIEEPEHHLHPGLIARFLKFIKTKCSKHQFIITTHSPTILDSADDSTSVYRTFITKEGNCSVEHCKELSQYHRIFDGMGVKASSLLLVNTTVWVEGPSDIQYLRSWFQLIGERDTDKVLVENSDYSFVIYGGSNISYLTADDSDNEQKINIPRLCRRIALLADKDTDESGAPKNNVQRLETEFEAHDGYHNTKIFQTSNREIENDVPIDVLKTALKSTFKDKLKEVNLEDFKLDNSERISKTIEKLANRSLDSVSGKTKWETYYNSKKPDLAATVMKLIKENNNQIDPPSYVSEIINFIIEGREPEFQPGS